MSGLVIPLAVVGITLAVIGVFIGLFVLRRYLLTRDIGTFDCALRREAGRAAGGWMLGVARYESDRLDWFRIFTMSPRPGRSLSRNRLVILDRRTPEGPESYAIMAGQVIVRCAYAASTLEFAMSESAYDGFATWLESAAPGNYSPYN